ncbi:MAG TPA: hybrid sensor histidine kinase/response regulator [Pseudobdellovibrionaceae bacterium]|nr:hybrid sensor histidine kinase/response regulator [Pseudobdellovibrionaceae bacterium]
MKTTILCVDDEVDNVDALERLFRRKYNVLRATSGQQALQVLQQHQGPVAVIITDQRMPQMTGVEFLEKTLTQHPDTVRILLTGYTDLESVIEAINKGQIYRYLTKPWDPVDLSSAVDRAVERYDLGQELKLKNKELAEAYRELKSLDTAKSNFMILVNHELKTPLTSVLNFNSLLAETKLDEEQALYTDRIRRSAEKLKTLVDDVLLIVKAETGQLKSDLRPVTIASLSAELPPDLTNTMNEKKQRLVENLSSAPVRADAAQIRQILHRLLHNAVKFGDSDSEIVLSSVPQERSLLFSVTNKGAPVSEKVIDKIFRPFFLDEDIMHHSTGMGLGLTICQSLLQTHSSGLNVKNNPDGVTVSFLLPSV